MENLGLYLQGLGAAILFCCYVGCSKVEAGQEFTHTPIIFEDPLTGCQYLTNSSGNAALTPRLDRDMKQICKGK
jgi:hypothetical protein